MKTILQASLALLVATLAFGTLGCPDPDRRPEQSGSAGPGRAVVGPAAAATDSEDPSTVVATMRGEPITLGEIDEQVEAELSQVQMECRQRIFDLRRSSIEATIAQRLFAEEAERMGLENEDAFIVQAVEKGTPFPSEEEARAFYEENRQMMGDQSFEAIQPRVVQFLHQRKQRERFESILGDLRQKAEVTVTLAEPRVAVDATGPSKGPADAPITIVEFSDFLCPFCSRGKDVMDQVKAAYGDQVRVVFRLYPSIENESSTRAAEASACAGAQDKFWQMHEALFAAQGQVSPQALKTMARGIEGMDGDKFDECLEGGEGRMLVFADIAAGRAAGVSGTPAYFVNGVSILGAQPFEAFKEIIDRELGLEGAAASAD